MSTIHEKNVRMSFPKRIARSILAWERKYDHVLQARNLMLKAWESGYSSARDDLSRNGAHPVNLIDRGMAILIPYLVMSNPKVLVTTEKTEFKPFALTTELALNHFLKEIKFAKRTLRPLVRDALLGLGIVKTGIARKWQIPIFGHLHDVGQPYADVIDISDYFGDCTSDNFEGFELEGNRFRMQLEVAQDLYPKYADRLKSSFGRWGDRKPPTAPQDNESGTLKNFVELAEVWLPDEKTIITIDPHDPDAKIMKTVHAECDESGPYDKLGFKNFSKTLIAPPPVWFWMDTDAALNVIVNKVVNQANSQKAVLTYEGDSAQDAQNIALAGDRQAIRVQSKDGVGIFEFPGVDREQYPWMQYLEGQYAKQEVNLDQLGGRSPAAETLGQEQMLFSTASKGVDDMVNQVYDTTSDVLTKLANFFWKDPLYQLPVIKRIPGYGDVEVMYDDAAREGEFFDYNFNVEPYSMQRLNPDAEYRKLLNFMGQWVLPTAQIAAQQGATIDVPVVTEQLARFLQLRELDNWYKPSVPSAAKLNPYNPQQGQTKNKSIADGRTGSNPASDQANSMQKTMKNGNPV